MVQAHSLSFTIFNIEIYKLAKRFGNNNEYAGSDWIEQTEDRQMESTGRGLHPAVDEPGLTR